MKKTIEILEIVVSIVTLIFAIFLVLELISGDLDFYRISVKTFSVASLIAIRLLIARAKREKQLELEDFQRDLLKEIKDLRNEKVSLESKLTISKSVTEDMKRTVNTLEAKGKELEERVKIYSESAKEEVLGAIEDSSKYEQDLNHVHGLLQTFIKRSGRPTKLFYQVFGEYLNLPKYLPK